MRTDIEPKGLTDTTTTTHQQREKKMTALPSDTPRIQPFLYYRDLPAAIECLTQAFGFQVVDEGSRGNEAAIEHAILDYCGGRVMLHSDTRVIPSGHLTHVYVDDVDAHFEVASGFPTVEIRSRPTDEPWGDRTYGARDVGGHDWAFAQRRS